MAKPALSKRQHPLQIGFTEQCSPGNGALLITEAVLEAKEQRKDLYVIMMDARKAFDIVWQESAYSAVNIKSNRGEPRTNCNRIYFYIAIIYTL